MADADRGADGAPVNGGDQPIKAEVELDWESLAVAFENQLPESHSFVDLRTGGVYTVVTGDGGAPPPPDPADQYLYIRPRPSREGYRTMQRFLDTVEDPGLREKLTAALVGKGAFRRFKDQLIAYPEVRQDWFAFKDAEVYAYIRSWLEREGIRPTNEPPATPSKEKFMEASLPRAAVPPAAAPVAPGWGQGGVKREPDESGEDWRRVIAPWDRPDVMIRPGLAALLVIDMQRVFVDPEGSTFLPMVTEASRRLGDLVQAFRRARLPVIFTRHVHHSPRQDGGALARWWRGLILEGTPDAQLVEAFRPLDGERVITKCRYSAFAGTPLEMVLRSLGVEDVLIGGVMTNLCCETTARDAFVRDFNVFFLGDGTATADEALHLSTLRNIAHGFGRVLGVADVLQAMERPGT